MQISWSIRFGLLVAFIVLMLDQVHKWWMLSVFDIAAQGRVVVTSFLDLVMVWNRGISYGLFQQDSMIGHAILVAFSLVAIGVLIYWLRSATTKTMTLALGLIIGGAAGNLVDRVVHGAVADFFLLHAFGYSWYVFNLADIAIVAGVALLLYDSISKGHNTASNDT